MTRPQPIYRKAPGSEGEALAIAVRIITLVNAWPGMWPRLFGLLADDGRTDWRHVERVMSDIIRSDAMTSRTNGR